MMRASYSCSCATLLILIGGTQSFATHGPLYNLHKSTSKSSTASTALFRKIETYGHWEDVEETNDANADGDEALFTSLINDKIQKNAEEVASDSNDDADTDVYEQQHLGEPSPLLPPEDVVPLIMNALSKNNEPHKDAGIKLMWEFATDTTKFVFKNNITEFIESCHDTANEFPTSFYGVAMKGQSWEMETEINRVGGEDGWIATQVMKTISSDGRLRRWQWEIRKNKRPPCLGCWKIESIASSDRNGDFQARDRGDGWSD